MSSPVRLVFYPRALDFYGEMPGGWRSIIRCYVVYSMYICKYIYTYYTRINK